ncbi:hypothetical protein [Alkalibacillus almallahensis]|uniref:hypothetical protein n=1 Tax=Alkalibacillus almallahensis TaxID=1379154 RepID=UPI0014211C08|nr:hypothetical protein [Alkalibacillus almallahensis]NIK11622.1 hypothetical protein [Alkalibacillus almallahensis]
MRLLEKVLTAILSGIIFSLGLTFVWDVWMYFWGYLFVSSAMFLIVGILFSILVDKITGNVKSYRYLYLVLFYLLGGVLLNLILYLFLFTEGFSRETYNMFILGIVASLLYLHILLINRKFLMAKWL